MVLLFFANGVAICCYLLLMVLLFVANCCYLVLMVCKKGFHKRLPKKERPQSFVPVVSQQTQGANVSAKKALAVDGVFH